MLIIPAVDIRGGRCVRLLQGDYARETVYGDDPVAVAERWAELGAERLHVVDLDGAAGEGPANLAVVARIVAAVSIPVQLGGGLKRWEHIARALEYGIDRVIVGTAAVENKTLVERSVRECAEAVIVGIDARNGHVSTHGWREASGIKALDLAREMADMGVRRLVYTDIARDGTLTEPNFAATAEMVNAVAIPVVASGGVAAVDHVRQLASAGVEGVIIGRALYTGHVGLAEVLQVARESGGERDC